MCLTQVYKQMATFPSHRAVSVPVKDEPVSPEAVMEQIQRIHPEEQRRRLPEDRKKDYTLYT